MTKERAVEASHTLEDVFTREGDAVVIARISDNGFMACVTGARHHEEWLPISSLRAREGL